MTNITRTLSVRIEQTQDAKYVGKYGQCWGVWTNSYSAGPPIDLLGTYPTEDEAIKAAQEELGYRLRRP